MANELESMLRQWKQHMWDSCKETMVRPVHGKHVLTGPAHLSLSLSLGKNR